MASSARVSPIQGGLILTVIGGVGAAVAYRWAPHLVLVSGPTESQTSPHGLLAWALGLLVALLGVATTLAGVFPRLADEMRRRRHSFGLVAAALVLGFLWAFYR